MVDKRSMFTSIRFLQMLIRTYPKDSLTQNNQRT